MSEPTIQYKFRIDSLEVDARTDSFSPHKVVLEANVDPVMLAVDVPLNHDCFVNSAEIITAQLTAGDIPQPILTTTGLKALTGVIETALHPKVAKDEPDSEDDWDDDTTSTNKSPKSDDDWGDTSTEPSKDEEW